jgi:hypothetical protein
MTEYADFQEQHTRERIAGIAKALRRMADEIDRDAPHASSLDSAVSGVIHTVQWGFANLNLSILVDNLSRYHQAVQADAGEEKP